VDDNAAKKFEDEKIEVGIAVPVTILGADERREIFRVGQGLAPGRTVSRLVLAFPQTHPDFPSKVYVVEVPSEVIEEYGNCAYDLHRSAHPEQNLPDLRKASAPGPDLLKTP
jgi:hypothetical protein